MRNALLPMLMSVCVLITHVGCQGLEHSSLSQGTMPSGKIQWQSWTEETFRQAKDQDKLILLDLTAVWCHACHVMDETTYQDPTIAQLLNQKFIPIKVDTDQRPDVESRYRNGGWPTTSILLPTGEILFQANLLGPEELLEALLASEEMYREQKEDLVKHASTIWEKGEQRAHNAKSVRRNDQS